LARTLQLGRKDDDSPSHDLGWSFLHRGDQLHHDSCEADRDQRNHLPVGPTDSVALGSLSGGLDYHLIGNQTHRQPLGGAVGEEIHIGDWLPQLVAIAAFAIALDCLVIFTAAFILRHLRRHENNLRS